jgi:hypothetical protein
MVQSEENLATSELRVTDISSQPRSAIKAEIEAPQHLEVDSCYVRFLCFWCVISMLGAESQ